MGGFQGIQYLEVGGGVRQRSGDAQSVDRRRQAEMERVEHCAEAQRRSHIHQRFHRRTDQETERKEILGRHFWIATLRLNAEGASHLFKLVFALLEVLLLLLHFIARVLQKLDHFNFESLI